MTYDRYTSDEPSKEQLKLNEARAYINSAPNNDERQSRKQEMYVALYSMGPERFLNYFDRMREWTKECNLSELD